MHPTALRPSRLAALLLASLASTASAIDYYKANNTTSLTNVASWWLDTAGTIPATTAPVNTTTVANINGVCIWNNLVTSPNTITLADVSILTLRVLDPGGAVTLDGVSGTRTVTVPNGGGIDMANATQDLFLRTMNYRTVTTSQTVNVQVKTGRTLDFASNAAVTVRNVPTGNSNTAIYNINTDGVSAGTVKFGANFMPGQINIGGGRVELNNPGGNNRGANVANATNVTGGTLVAGNISGSATGTSPITLNAGATLTGAGLISGVVTANSSATIAPGATAPGTLTVGSLTLASGSSIVWEASNPASADRIAITTTDGLVIDGATLKLYEPGTTTPFRGTGEFTLFTVPGTTIGGLGLSALTIDPATQVANRSYALNHNPGAGTITLTIVNPNAVNVDWLNDASGLWSSAANWSGGTVPDVASVTARISGSGSAHTAPRTVTLDSPRTIGSLVLDAAQPLTLAGSSLLAFDNDGGPATLTASSGHTIQPPLALTTGGLLVTVTGASDTLTLSGAVSGANLGLVKAGDGTLLLTGANTYSGSTSITGGTLQIGDGGTSGSIAGPVLNNGTLRHIRSDAVTLSQVISGTGAVEFTGDGTTTLAAANTYSGATTLSGGALVLADPLALQNSTLTYATSGGSLNIDPAVTAVTLGGLAGDRAFPLANSAATPISLNVGQNNASTAYSASPAGTGVAFTKSGTGTLALTGAHAYSGNATVANGTLSLDTGATFTAAAANLGTGSTARILVNGGTLTVTAPSLVTNPSVGIVVAAGTANFQGGILTEASNASNESFIHVTGGTLNTASVTLSRGSLIISSTAAPTAGQTANGLYVNGGTVNITGVLDIGTGIGANSSVSSRLDAGSLTVGGPVTVALNNTGRWSVLDLFGGTFTSTDTTTGVQLGGAFVGKSVLLVRGTTVAKAERIQFGQGAVAGTAQLSLTGGSLLVGSGGLVLGSSEPAFVTTVALDGGTLGATADWNTTLPVTLNGNISVTASDETLTPRIITLQGAATGLGALTVTGPGTLRMESPSNDYFGPTTVQDGTLTLAGRTGGLITVAAGANLAPLGALTADSAATIEGTLDIAYSASSSPQVNSITASAGSFTLGAASTLALSGTGPLTEPAYVLLKGTAAVSGTFASVTGMPSGYTLNYAYDDDANEFTPAVVALVAAPASPYETWAASFPGFTDTLPGSDPDGDGLSNFGEYALAQSPVVNDAASAYTVGRSGNFLTLAFDHPADATLRYEIEAKTDLAAASWTVVHTYYPFATAGSEVYTDTEDLAVTPRRFLRLKVTQTP